ncbi:MAG: serine hydrolase, partial [Glutamicibacter ardleyensis]
MSSGLTVPELTIANWQHPENIQVSFQNIAEFLPTTKVSRGDESIAKLPFTEMEIGDLEVAKGSATDPSLTVRGVINSTNTDGLLIMRKGKVMVEKYYNTMTSLTDHLLMSMSKTVVGTVAAALVSAEKLDVNKLVTDYVPALERSGYAGATVRHLLDMRSGIQFS